MRSRGPLPWRS